MSNQNLISTVDTSGCLWSSHKSLFYVKPTVKTYVNIAYQPYPKNFPVSSKLDFYIAPTGLTLPLSRQKNKIKIKQKIMWGCDLCFSPSVINGVPPTLRENYVLVKARCVVFFLLLISSPPFLLNYLFNSFLFFSSLDTFLKPI